MRASFFGLVLVLAGAAPAVAQHRPHADWRELESEHFRVVFENGLDSIAQHAARRAEVAHARLTAELSRAPKGKIDIVIGDNLDLTNGAATPIPANRILLWTKPPTDDLALSYFNDWMDLVIAHELTHIFHLDRAGKVGRLLRTVFGRVPFGWPFFPSLGTPDWITEGLATYRESVHTGAGRTYGTYHDMILRTAILENDFPSIDRVSGETPIWPGGQRAYIYGSLFMQYIAQKVGPQAHREIVNKTAGSLLPPPWVVDRIARRATGKSFTQLYAEWRSELSARYAAGADSARATPLTTGERIAGGERYAWYPRVSPDGLRLAYAADDGRSTASTVVIDLASGRSARTRRNSLAPLAWVNNHTVATTQPELSDPYSIYTDLYYQRAGQQQRLTRGARYDAVDADRRGSKLLVIANSAGITSLVQFDASTGEDRVIVEGRPDVQWASARWSPDGTLIAAQRWSLGGRQDIVVMDTLGAPLRTRSQAWLATERAIDAAPAWSADGRWVLFTSDHSGVNNIHAFAIDDHSGLVLRVTNVLTGAFFPEVSPDGAWIYYSAYHANGYAIERIRFDPQQWVQLRDPRAADGTTVIIPEQTGPPLPVRNYSALRSALPRFWLPYIQSDSALGTFLGAFTAGFDDVGRHSYVAGLAFNFENGRTIASLAYTYAGLGNPLLSFEASRDYDMIGDLSVRREDNVALIITLLRPRWRSNLALSLGVEGTVIKRDTVLAAFDPEDRLVGVVAGIGIGNYRTPAYAISPEDGIRAAFFARRRFDIDPVLEDDTYSELNGQVAAYRSINAFGFAHHVVAARASGIYRTGLGVGPTDAGGEGDFLPVRGFDDGDRIGWRAWSASLEYRVPIAMIGRGIRLWPVFVDRVAASAFIDAGNAACTAAQRSIYTFCPGGSPTSGDDVLLSAGAEIISDVAFLSFIPVWLRAGVAQPIQGPRSSARFYFTLGQSF
jgi:hypothetical protein